MSMTRAHDRGRGVRRRGMFHCRGGFGPDRFDALTPLINRVEGGRTPDSIVASREECGETGRTLSLCPRPRIALDRLEKPQRGGELRLPRSVIGRPRAAALGVDERMVSLRRLRRPLGL